MQAVARAGRQDAAEVVSTVSPGRRADGLLSEQIDPITERVLGNFPQAYSHLAVIDAGLVLQEG